MGRPSGRVQRLTAGGGGMRAEGMVTWWDPRRGDGQAAGRGGGWQVGGCGTCRLSSCFWLQVPFRHVKASGAKVHLVLPGY